MISDEEVKESLLRSAEQAIHADVDVSCYADGVRAGVEELLGFCYLFESDSEMSDYTWRLVTDWVVFVACQDLVPAIGGSLADYCADAVLTAFDGYEIRIIDEFHGDVAARFEDHIVYGEMPALDPQGEMDALAAAGIL